MKFVTRSFRKILTLKWASWGSWLTSILRRIPLTLALFSIILIAGIVTQTITGDAWQSLMQRFGWSLPALKAGKLYAPWAGLIFGSRPGHYQSILAIGLLGVGLLEYHRGTKWAAVGFLLLGPVSSIITTLLLWPLDILGLSWVRSSLYTPDMGSSGASLVCWGLFVGGGHGWWQKLLLWGTILLLVLLLIFLPAVWEIDHMIAFLFGLLVSLSLQSRRSGIIAS